MSTCSTSFSNTTLARSILCPSWHRDARKSLPALFPSSCTPASSAMALVAPIDSVLLPSDVPLRPDAVPRHHACAGRSRHAFSPDHFLHHRLAVSASKPLKKWLCSASGRSGPSGDEEGGGECDDQSSSSSGKEKQDIEKALHLDGSIPPTSDRFLKQVSSRAYDMRRRLEQTIDTSSYDVLEANPWRDDSKPVYVLAQEENKLLTMRTRRARSEVENELSLLFPKRGSRRGSNGFPRSSSQLPPSSKSSHDTRFRMVVEDVREGVLVFEDEEEATRYCSLLDGQGKSCMGVAELDASDVFSLCKNIKAFAVLFRRGRTPPLPDHLQLNLKARKHSLED